MPQGKRTAQGAAGGLLGFVGLSAAAGLLVTAAVTPALAVTGMTANNAMGVFNSLPEVLKIGQPMERSNIYVTKANGDNQLLASFYDQNRQEVGWDDVSQTLKDAAVSTEDPRFYEHGGIDVAGTTRAIVKTYVVGGQTQGGSSITQQYVKNVLVQDCEQHSTTEEELQACSSEATTADGQSGMARKLKEMRYAIGVEKQYSKDDILLGYLNLANFGSLNYGVETASNYYFNKSAKDVNIQEAATLVAMLNSPSALRIDNPDGVANGKPNTEENNWEQTKERRNYVISNMLKEGKITQEEADKAKDSKIEPDITAPSTGCYTAGGSAYFCDYVQNVVKNNPAFGDTAEERSATLRRGGLNIYTTLDLDLQLSAEKSMKNYVDANPQAISKVGAAASTVEPGTGRVLSMVQNTKYAAGETDDPAYSSINYNTDYAYGGSSGFQVGSTYKFYTLVEWLKEGHSLNERIVDAANRNPSVWNDSCAGGTYNFTYPVQNFNSQYSNSVTALQATKESINTAYLGMARELDLCKIRDTAMDLGAHRADGKELDKYPSSVLGSNEMAPLTVAASVAALGAEGKYCEPTAIDKIVGPDGKEMALPEQDCHQAVDKEVANTANFGMQSVFEGGGTGAGAAVTGAEVYGKTGTSDHARASWISGGTSKAVTSLWIGAVQGDASMYQTYFNAGTGHMTKLYLWRDIMQQAINEFGGDDFAGPSETLTRVPQTQVPDVTGLTVEEAQERLRSVGFSWAIGDAAESSVEEGKVASTSPAGGASAASGSQVTITPSSGEAEESDVPDVRGDSPGDAAKTLSDAGFSVDEKCRTGDKDDDEIDKVVGQSPGEGSKAKDGDTVTIDVLRESC
ncbi:transglycosylase domain-containing protein [Mycetocola reblochoni]|uniref:transglycosylase domain-containing protein n=1 Tax=Mycetocola reblochoni TaxID=331618 RepID=UPI003F99848A